MLAFLDTCQAGAVGGTHTRSVVNNDALVNDLIRSGSGLMVFAAELRPGVVRLVKKLHRKTKAGQMSLRNISIALTK